LVSPALANGINIQFALWFGVILCGGSVASCLLISSIDKHLDSQMGGKGAHSLLVAADDNDNEDERAIEERNKQLRKSLMEGAEGHAEVLQARQSIERHPSNASEKAAEAKQEVKFRDIFSFGQIFWILSVICVVVYGKLFRHPFTHNYC
jgi:hypothetical protein